jgi:peptide/nickel transport system ATP-binding protein
MLLNENDVFLSVRDLNVIYTSRKKVIHAVNGVSLQMTRGETLGLVGETGAGKTTIAKSILRILPDPPAKVLGGEILLDGRNLMAYPEKEMLRIRGEKVAMIFQDPMTALNPLMTVGDQIMEGLRLHNDYSEGEAAQKAKELLETVGIHSERFKEYPFEFSGGMKQRVVIAMALACEPELLLADEPTTALDVTIQAQVLDLINKLRAKYHTSMILITHNLGVVAQTCDRVAVIYAGKIIEYGSKRDIFVDYAHPYTHGLFASLPSFSKDAPRLKPIAGSMPDPTRLPQGCAFHPRCPFVIDVCQSGEIPLTQISQGHFCRCSNLQQRG